MYETGNSEARLRKRWHVASIAAALLGAAVLCQPNTAHALPPLPGVGPPWLPTLSGGGFGGLPGGAGHGGWAGGYGGGGHGSWGGGYGYGGYGYPSYGVFVGGSVPSYTYYSYSQPSVAQVWYYCSAPAGYYPYVTQCSTAWQTVPATGAVSQGGGVGVAVSGASYPSGGSSSPVATLAGAATGLAVAMAAGPVAAGPAVTPAVSTALDQRVIYPGCLQQQPG
jgi:hypothetical protein